MNKIRFAYIKDPENTNRVVTIGYYLLGDMIYFDTAVNKVVDSKSITLDQRLRQVVGNIEYQELQKRFRKKFGGDNHCKKKARSILIGRLAHPRYSILHRKDISILTDILGFLIDNGYDSNGEPLAMQRTLSTIRDVCIRSLDS